MNEPKFPQISVTIPKDEAGRVLTACKVRSQMCLYTIRLEDFEEFEKDIESDYETGIRKWATVTESGTK